MPFQIVHNDICKMQTEAIVNAANTELRMGTGVCGTIFKSAGIVQLEKACSKIGHCSVGQAVITQGYDLYAHYIIHTVGPVWCDENINKEVELEQAYTSALLIAQKKGIKSIAFPLISSGNYGCPKEQALYIATAAIKKFLSSNDMQIYLVVYDRQTVALSKHLYQSIRSYIDTYYEEVTLTMASIGLSSISGLVTSAIGSTIAKSATASLVGGMVQTIGDLLKKKEETFSELILRLIQEKGKTDVEVYKGANIDRKLFSKIRNNKGYMPKKKTAIALAIALELSLQETNVLLAKAGYTLTKSSEADIIVQYYIENGEYDIFAINEALFEFKQALLGTA